MNLVRIYQPIADDLKKVECFLQVSVKESKNQTIRQMSNSLLESGGKRLRPALVILSAKAASLFAASCHAGTILGNHSRIIQTTLKEYGLNFGIAFQIIDDCRDIVSEERVLGKQPGHNVAAGDMTLPLLNLLDVIGSTGRLGL